MSYIDKYLKYVNKNTHFGGDTISIEDIEIDIESDPETSNVIDYETCIKKRINYERDMYNKTRTPSFCDRIIYKGDINPLKYDSYVDEIISRSDHNLVYGEFEYLNKKYILLTWNVAGKNHTNINERTLSRLYDQLLDKNFDYLIFSLQELADTTTLKNQLKTLLEPKGYKCDSHEKQTILSLKFGVQLLIFYKPTEVTKQTGEIYKSTTSHISSKDAKCFEFICIKLYVLLDLGNGLTIVACHLPVKPSDRQTLGNNNRINALKKIMNDVKNKQNVIIIGDLNFRIVQDNKEQLTEFLNSNDNKLNDIQIYKEFTSNGEPLKHPSCKLDTCKQSN